MALAFTILAVERDRAMSRRRQRRRFDERPSKDVTSGFPAGSFGKASFHNVSGRIQFGKGLKRVGGTTVHPSTTPLPHLRRNPL